MDFNGYQSLYDEGFLFYEKMREYLVNAVPHEIEPDPFQINPFLFTLYLVEKIYWDIIYPKRHGSY